MRTFYSYFRGGGGAEVGAEFAGYTSVGGVEFEQAIADVCDANFPYAPTTVADVCAVDPATLLSTAPDWFHASPSCRNASQAKLDAGETDEDREAGKAVARFISHWKPAKVTIENVWGYRVFDAFAIILQTLQACGYSYEYWHLNAADYGVPQTRKRLILVAKLGSWRIQRPEPTHRDGGDWFLPAWNGWYQAIEDLIPTLPESRFAAWQLARLPEEFVGSFYTVAQQSDDKKDEGVGYGCPRRSPTHPALTVTATQSAGWYKAFIVDGTPTDHGERVTVPNRDEPMMTVTANGLKRSTRAFLMSNAATEYGDGIRDGCEPARTISTQSNGRTRAFLIRDDNAGQEWGKQYREADEPAFTQSQSSGGRAWLDHGRVVAMTPHALARFQSFPDSYVLPAKAALACKVIGNAVPPLLMQRIGESL